MDPCGSCPCDVVEIELIVEKELGDEEFCSGLDLFYGDFEVLFWGGAVDVFFGVAGAADAEAVVVGEVVDEVVGVGKVHVGEFAGCGSFGGIAAESEEVFDS